MKPGDLVKLGPRGCNRPVSLLNGVAWQFDDSVERRSVYGFKPGDIGLVLAVVQVKFIFQTTQLLILCRGTFGWQSESYFDEVT